MIFMGGSFRAFRHRDDLGGKVERDNDEQGFGVGADDEKSRPSSQSVKTVAAT
jgi:hypothetical protein